MKQGTRFRPTGLIVAISMASGAFAHAAKPPASAAPSATRAPAATPAPAPAAPVSLLEPGRSTALSQRFTQTLQDGCAYEVSVRGTIREWRMANSGPSYALPGTDPRSAVGLGRPGWWQPDLTVESSMQCPARAIEQRSSGTVRGGVTEPSGLQQALSLRGTTAIGQGERTCTYAPQFSFAGARLVSEGLLQECEAPPGAAPATPPGSIGGGPRNTDNGGDATAGSRADTPVIPALPPPAEAAVLPLTEAPRQRAVPARPAPPASQNPPGSVPPLETTTESDAVP